MASDSLTTQGILDKKIRVLYVSPGDANDPSNMVFITRQINGISRKGVVSDLFFIESRTSLALIFEEVVRFRAMLHTFQPDLVHAQFGSVTALFSALFCTLPLVISYRGSDLNHDPSVSTLRSALQLLFSQLAALRATKILCVSKQLSRRLWWRQGLVGIIPSGVNMELFHPIPREIVRKKLGWDLEERVVFFNAGRSPRLKRLDLAQEAIREAVKIIGPVRLEVLNGTRDPEEIPLLMNASNCILLASDFEGSPNVVKEAIACGVPVVSVDVGDVGERLKEVRPSFLVERDVEQIGRAIAKAIQMNERTNGPAIASRDLDQKVIIGKIIAAYREALNLGSES